MQPVSEACFVPFVSTKNRDNPGAEFARRIPDAVGSSRARRPRVTTTPKPAALADAIVTTMGAIVAREQAMPGNDITPAHVVVSTQPATFAEVQAAITAAVARVMLPPPPAELTPIVEISEDRPLPFLPAPAAPVVAAPAPASYHGGAPATMAYLNARMIADRGPEALFDALTDALESLYQMADYADLRAELDQQKDDCEAAEDVASERQRDCYALEDTVAEQKREIANLQAQVALLSKGRSAAE